MAFYQIDLHAVVMEIFRRLTDYFTKAALYGFRLAEASDKVAFRRVNSDAVNRLGCRVEKVVPIIYCLRMRDSKGAGGN